VRQSLLLLLLLLLVMTMPLTRRLNTIEKQRQVSKQN